jgi:hypothetical protein
MRANIYSLTLRKKLDRDELIGSLLLLDIEVMPSARKHSIKQYS